MSSGSVDVVTATEKSAAAPRGRSKLVDNAKAIGIVLVVLGHASGLPLPFSKGLFAFHMPLFFFLSGMLLNDHKFQRGRAAFLGERARAMFVPYTVFFVLSWAYWLATARLGHRAEKFAHVGWVAPWHGYFTGLSRDLVIVNPTLWFFPCLFFVTAYYCLTRWVVSRRVSTMILVLFGALVVVFSHRVNALPFRLPMGIDVACVAVSFYAVGQQVRESIETTVSSIGGVRRVMLLSIVLACFFATFPLNGGVDMQAQKYGTMAAVFLVASLSGIAATLLVGSLLPSNAVARWLSENTLIIFPTHTLIFNLLSGLAQALFAFSPRTQAGLGYALATTAIALLCAVPVAAIVRRPLLELVRHTQFASAWFLAKCNGAGAPFRQPRGVSR